MDYAEKNIVSRNSLCIISFKVKVTLFATIIPSDILFYPQISGNHFSYPCIITVMRFDINCISNPFLQKCQPCLCWPNYLFAWRTGIFLKARDSIIICLDSEFGIILFTAEVNLCKKPVKASFVPCITL